MTEAAADRPGELQGRRSDAAAGRMHEGVLARAQAAALDEGIGRCEEHLRDRPGLQPAEARRDGEELPGRNRRPFGVPAPAQDAHHAVARRPSRDVRPDLLDLTGELEPRDIRGDVSRRGVAAEALQQIGPVDARAAHAHDDLARPGHGVVPLYQFQHVRAAGLPDADRFHRSASPTPKARRAAASRSGVPMSYHGASVTSNTPTRSPSPIQSM